MSEDAIDQMIYDGLFDEWNKQHVEYVKAIGEDRWNKVHDVVSDDSTGLVVRCGTILMNLLILMNTTGVEVDVGMAVAQEDNGDVCPIPTLVNLDFLTDKDKEYLSELFNED